MRAKIEITMDNAAFDEPATELGRILRETAGKIEKYGLGANGDSVTLIDANGNHVGEFKIIGRRP